MTVFSFLLLHCLVIALLSAFNVASEFVVKIKQKSRQLLRHKEKKLLVGESHMWCSKILTPWHGASQERLHCPNLVLLRGNNGLFVPTRLLVHKPNCDQVG